MKRKHFFIMLALSMAASLTSCYPKFSDRVYFLDYSRFADEGFFITESNTVPFDYKPIGSVLVEERPGKKEVSMVHKPGYDPIYGEDNAKTTKSIYTYASADSALEALQKFAKENNADGVINIKISRGEGSERPYFFVSGMLIKRK